MPEQERVWLHVSVYVCAGVFVCVCVCVCVCLCVTCVTLVFSKRKRLSTSEVRVMQTALCLLCHSQE
jgi:hypothetical protein